MPRGWTRGAAWKGAGASILLHLFVGAAMIVALSGPPKAPPQVIDLTLLPSAGIARRPAPPAFLAAGKPSRDPGTAALPESPALPASPMVANPPDAPGPANPTDPTMEKSASEAASPRSSAAVSPRTPGGLPSMAPVPTGRNPVTAPAASPQGIPGAGSPAEDFAWIRDAIQDAIAYPATARRMGWEGEVVVAFQLLSDGSVRDVRVVQGSGHAALDRGAIDAVRNASPFPRSPVEAEVITPVVYRLTTR
ncbi:MAG: energy transducer TonB [Desulfobacteria bacterium]